MTGDTFILKNFQFLFNSNIEYYYCIPFLCAGVGYYTGDGMTATAAFIKSPTDMAFDSLGNMYIVDNGLNVVRKLDASTGIASTIAGNEYVK